MSVNVSIFLFMCGWTVDDDDIATHIRVSFVYYVHDYRWQLCLFQMVHS